MLADLSDRSKFLLRGPDARRYLNGQVTNDITRLRTGDSCYALVCNHKGRLEADLFIHAVEQGFLIDSEPALRDSLVARLGKYIVSDDCEVIDVTDDWALFHEIDGALPRQGEAAPEPGRTCDDRNRWWGEAGSEPQIIGRKTFATMRFGIPGRDYWLPASNARPPADATPETIELLRIERGIPAWGAELTSDILPQEAGIEDRAIDFQKGCYIGQEVISRIKSIGHVNRLVVPLAAVESGDWLRAGMRLFAGEPPASVGAVTSARFHPGMQKSIALGLVKRTFAAVGVRFHAGPVESEFAGQVEIRKMAPSLNQS